MISVYNIEHFVDLPDYFDDLERLIDHLHTSRVDPNVGEIQVPGEPEFRTAEHRRAEGIEIDSVTWSRICDAGRLLDLEVDSWEKQALGA